MTRTMTPPRNKTGRKGSDGGKPKPLQINVKVEQPLAGLLEKYLSDQRPRTSAPEVMRTALEDWLASRGYSATAGGD
jgi:hypothetical protein